MFFDFSLRSSLLLIFFFHGVAFSLVLLYQGLRLRQSAALWLSLFTVLCCLYISPWMLGFAGWYTRQFYRDLLFYLPLQHLFLLGPILLQYTQRLFEPHRKMEHRDWLHFLPALAYLVYSGWVGIADAWIFDEPHYYANGRDKDYAAWYQLTGVIHMLVYLGLCIWQYRRYQERLDAEVSFADALRQRWVRRYLVAFLIMQIARLIFLVAFPSYQRFGDQAWYYVLFSVLFYYIAGRGYGQTVAEAVTVIRTPMLSESRTNEEERDSALTDPEQDAGMERLREAMEQKHAYSDPQLTLQGLAALVGMTGHQLSATINQGFGVNFNDFVNGYRVQAVQKAIDEGQHQQFTLLSLALDQGFNSKSTFNRVFKKHAGMTPAQYVQAQMTEKGGAKS